MSAASPLPNNRQPLRLAALISGGGRTLLNLADHIRSGRLAASIAGVIASREDCPGVAKARMLGLPVHVASRSAFASEQIMHDQTTRWIVEARTDLVCLCGYLRFLRVDAPLKDRVINIHPALLPDFGGQGMYGQHVHQAVLASGHKESGCTVHVVDEQYDHGPTILQRRCPVLPNDTPDTLAARVFEQECIAYPAAIQQFAAGRISIKSGQVCIQPGAQSV